MANILRLTITAALPVLASVLLYIAETGSRRMRELPGWQRQLLAGLVFGGIAVIGTEFGTDIGGAVINARDAAPLCAGLLFGGPAGILAGLVGGVERWFSVYWGVGSYTRLACTLATILAGFFGAALRKYLLEDQRPSWFYGLFAGVVMEVLHMLLIFLTNMSDIARVFAFVEGCTLPMICLNSLAVTLAVVLVERLERLGRQKEQEQGQREQEQQRQRQQRQGQRRISQTFQRWLALVMAAAFLVTTLFNWVLQTRLARENAQRLLSLNLEDVRQEIRDQSDRNLLGGAYLVQEDLNRTLPQTREEDVDRLLGELCQAYNLSEVSIVDSHGIITHSTYPGFVGYNMGDGDQSREFLVLLDGSRTEYAQAFGPVSSDHSVFRKYAGVVLDQGGFVQVGYDGEMFQSCIDSLMPAITRNRHVGEDGSMIVADRAGRIICGPRGSGGEAAGDAGLWSGEPPVRGEYFTARVYGTISYCTCDVSEGYFILAVLPWAEVYTLRNVSEYLTVFMETVVFAVLFVVVYFLIQKLIVENIRKINQALDQISGGNLEVTVDVNANEEFAALSGDINATVATLKRYIAEAAARIDQELEYAREIQLSVMPRVYPPFPNRKEFDIYATMCAAKEVGGDFYDFYLLGENRLAFLIADVSGKGIPAAMFMMTARTLIKSLAESGLEPDEVFTRANEQLCADNDTGMFVTAWMGILDLTSGHVSFVNGGHNPPVILRSGGEASFLRTRPGFVLAGMEGVEYRKETLKLAPGDKIYLYTDGVTEAMDSSQTLYGEKRLLALLETKSRLEVQQLCQAVLEDIDRFVGTASQFDDITMLALEWRG